MSKHWLYRGITTIALSCWVIVAIALEVVGRLVVGVFLLCDVVDRGQITFSPAQPLTIPEAQAQLSANSNALINPAQETEDDREPPLRYEDNV